MTDPKNDNIQKIQIWEQASLWNPQDTFIFSTDCGNPMSSKIVNWKIQTDLTHVKTIQYDAVGKVLDCFYTSEEACIFNFPFLNTLD